MSLRFSRRLLLLRRRRVLVFLLLLIRPESLTYMTDNIFSTVVTFTARKRSHFCWLGSYSLKSLVLWTFLLLLRKLLIKFWLKSLYLLSWLFASPNHLETLYSSVTTRRRRKESEVGLVTQTQQHMQFLRQETEGVLFLWNLCRLLLHLFLTRKC